MKPKWRRSQDYTPSENDLPIAWTRPEWSDRYFEVIDQSSPSALRFMWVPLSELNLPTEVMDPPLPEPWRPMEELADGHPELVLVARERGYSPSLLVHTYRATDEHDRRIAWMPLPRHPRAER